MDIIKKGAFTLMETMVAFSLALIIIGIVLSTNFFFQIKKAGDTKKKEDMARIQRIVEDYYADHHVYPPVSEMTYDVMQDTSDAGRVCGSKNTGNTILPYSRELPCSPNSPVNDYVYFLANTGQDYAVFVVISNENDPTLQMSVCNKGCSYYLNPEFPGSSISNNYFNYDVTSPSLILPACAPNNYIGCYPHTRVPCRGCPNGSCGDYARLYCKNVWCQSYCNK
jgi:type II secretory pathway pseudopilin PulG